MMDPVSLAFSAGAGIERFSPPYGLTMATMDAFKMEETFAALPGSKPTRLAEAALHHAGPVVAHIETEMSA